jgi:hypothetical protein
MMNILIVEVSQNVVVAANQYFILIMIHEQQQQQRERPSRQVARQLASTCTTWGVWATTPSGS